LLGDHPFPKWGLHLYWSSSPIILNTMYSIKINGEMFFWNKLWLTLQSKIPLLERRFYFISVICVSTKLGIPKAWNLEDATFLNFFLEQCVLERCKHAPFYAISIVWKKLVTYWNLLYGELTSDSSFWNIFQC
jgi:hypothetical protein